MLHYVLVCRTALLKLKIGYHSVIAPLYPAICLPLVLAIGPESLNVVIFAILGIYTTTALHVENRLKATTIVLLARENVWCVLHLLKNKSKKL